VDGPGRISRLHSGHSLPGSENQGNQSIRSSRHSVHSPLEKILPVAVLQHHPPLWSASDLHQLAAGTSNARTLLLHSTEKYTDTAAPALVALWPPSVPVCDTAPSSRRAVSGRAQQTARSSTRLSERGRDKLPIDEWRICRPGASQTAAAARRRPPEIPAELARSSGCGEGHDIQRASALRACPEHARRPPSSRSRRGAPLLCLPPGRGRITTGLEAVMGWLARRRGQSPHGLLSPRPADREKTHKSLYARWYFVTADESGNDQEMAESIHQLDSNTTGLFL